jgi:hypothetical protein
MYEQSSLVKGSFSHDKKKKKQGLQPLVGNESPAFE